MLWVDEREKRESEWIDNFITSRSHVNRLQDCVMWMIKALTVFTGNVLAAEKTNFQPSIIVSVPPTAEKAFTHIQQSSVSPNDCEWRERGKKGGTFVSLRAFPPSPWNINKTKAFLLCIAVLLETSNQSDVLFNALRVSLNRMNLNPSANFGEEFFPCWK